MYNLDLVKKNAKFSCELGTICNYTTECTLCVSWNMTF